MFWGFIVGGKNMGQGSASGGGPHPDGHLARPGGRPRHQGAWVPSGPPLANLLVMGSSWCVDFLYFNGNFPGHLKIHITAHKKTIHTALLKPLLVRVSFIQIMQE